MRMVTTVRNETAAKELVRVLCATGVRAWYNHAQPDGSVSVFWEAARPLEVN